MAGIKETDDVVKAAGAVALFILQASKNGYGLDDLRSALNNETLRREVVEGVRGINAVPGEISDVDLGEVVQLALSALEEFREVFH